MFKITKDGATMAMTEAPNYIKQAENGCFVLCPEAEATGIAHGRGSGDRQGGRRYGDRVRHNGGGRKRGRDNGGGTRGPFRAVGGAGGLYRGPDPQIYGREAV